MKLPPWLLVHINTAFPVLYQTLQGRFFSMRQYLWPDHSIFKFRHNAVYNGGRSTFWDVFANARVESVSNQHQLSQHVAPNAFQPSGLCSSACHLFWCLWIWTPCHWISHVAIASRLVYTHYTFSVDWALIVIILLQLASSELLDRDIENCMTLKHTCHGSSYRLQCDWM